jgi:hypothetical protein
MGSGINDNGLAVFLIQGSISRPTVANGGHRALEPAFVHPDAVSGLVLLAD